MLDVSPLVKSVISAATEAIQAHLSASLNRYAALGRRPEDLVTAWAAGFEGDLNDARPSLDGAGFDHELVSEVFREHMRALARGSTAWLSSTGLAGRARRRWGPGSTLDRHVWGQDYERGLAALLSDTEVQAADGLVEALEPEPAREGEFRNRTRASALTQRCLLASRRTLDPARSLRSARLIRGARVPLPSSLWITRELLTDPEYPASENYATAALRNYIYAEVTRAFGRSPDLSYEALTSAYKTVVNRERVSRPRYVTDPETAMICHYLAMKGDFFIHLPAPLLLEEMGEGLGRELGALLTKGSRAAFRLNSAINSLPSASDLLTELTSLPLPVEGADVLFRGGLRLSRRGDLVGAISGTFGAGKTSFCLGLAAALAPIGGRTLFLTSEEEPEDLGGRLDEATPEHVLRSTPLFNGVQLRRANGTYPWFFADRLRLKHEAASGSDFVSGLRNLLVELLEPLNEDSVAPGLEPPTLIVVDGFHALFGGVPTDVARYEAALAELVDFCRSRRAIFLFTSGEEDRQVLRLEYLCDLVVSLDRIGFEALDRQPARVLKLLKARRQAVRAGAHIFHLTAPRGLRIKPSLAAMADATRSRAWSRADPRKVFAVRPRVEGRLASSTTGRPTAPLIEFRDLSQILVRGLGSSGKSGLSLSLLHRRPVFSRHARRDSRSAFFLDRRLSEEPVGSLHETRVLIVSFLYQEDYYARFIPRLYSTASVAVGEEGSKEGGNDLLFEDAAPIVDETAVGQTRLRSDVLRQETVALFPGGLLPEDLLAKLDRRLRTAELRGLPFTGVLIDGLHNVFLQFPALEQNPGLWPQIFSLLRKRGVTTVTTHTDFQIGRGSSAEETAMLDAKAAQAKAAPLLSVLVSAGDYVLDVVPNRSPRGSRSEHRFEVVTRESLEGGAPAELLLWDRMQLQWILSRPAPSG